MGLFNFQPRFVPFIRSGAKRQTIRSKRKHVDRPGDTMYLYQGLRTPAAELILAAPCVSVEEIRLAHWSKAELLRVSIDGRILNPLEARTLFQQDGFDGLDPVIDAWGFWKDRLPFHGHLYRWAWPGAQEPSRKHS